ncbi:phosphatase PAP2 family protein [Streptomyces sp. PKU-EA00015]|uniref:phosphatase PAP2 family protein n=1 Tax=Streptomyces sp. PKU-EA00015 TaxID=2748326 RepID=UPI0015A48624|nr:phosphatase PAP2 family protein [Streptomyces sp. PKU-EA00015]NWF25669.1 phosphatase PAP2 family protein [Streptomyces sp. PKU-EA00015]
MTLSRPLPPAPSPARRPAPRMTAAARTGTVCLALTAVLTVLVVLPWSPLLAFDRDVAEALHSTAVAEPGLTRVNRVLTDWVWDPWTMRLLAATATVWLWLRGERLLAVWVAAASALAAAVQQSLKAMADRERPQWPDPVDSAQYAAFPSGHAMTAAVTCGLLLWLARRYGASGAGWAWGVALAVVSVAGVGLTRVYLGVHWPSDVVAGWLLGAAVVTLTTVSYHRAVLSRRR